MKKISAVLLASILMIALFSGSLTSYAKEAVLFDEGTPEEQLYTETVPEDLSEEVILEETAIPEEEEASNEPVPSKEPLVSEEKDSEDTLQLMETPATPVLKSAASVSNGVKITWNAVKNADSYIIYRWFAKTKEYKKIGTSTTTSFTETGLTSGTQRYYTVAAVIGDVTGAYDYDGIIGVYLARVKPTVTVRAGKASLSWNASDGCEGYRVYRREKGTASWTKLADTTTRKYTDATLKGGTDYEYCVRSFKKVKNKNYLSNLSASITASVTLLHTPKITKIVSKDNGIKFRWNKDSGAVSYQVYRKTEDSAWEKLGVTSSNAYLDKSAEQGTIYYYTVSAIAQGGEESFYYKKGTFGTFLATVKITTIQNKGGVFLEWEKVKGADGYRLYRKEAGETYKAITSLQTCTYKDTEGESGKKYAYVVRAYKNINGKPFYGYYDEADGAVILKLDTPLVKAAPAAGGKITLSWDPVKGATAYLIYQWDEGNQEWNKIKGVTVNSYTKSNVMPGEVLKFTAVARKGSYLSDMSENGASATYLDMVEIKSASSTENGILVKWNAVKAAKGYRLLRKEPGGKWTHVGFTSKTEFTDGHVKEGIKYRYLVKAFVIKDKINYYGLYDTAKAFKRFYTSPVYKLTKQYIAENGGTLKGAYDWLVSLDTASEHAEDDIIAQYALWTYRNKSGDAFGKAAAFCLMAREMGYEAEMISGSYLLKSGDKAPHAWVEIIDEGEIFVCDPFFEAKTLSDGYFFNYGQAGTWLYDEDHVVN